MKAAGSVGTSIPSHSANSSYVIGSPLGGSSWTGCLGVNGFFSGSEAGALASAILAWVSRCVTVSYRIREGGCLVLPLLLGAAVGGSMKASSACEWWGSQSSNDRRCTITPAKGPASETRDRESGTLLLRTPTSGQARSTTSKPRGNS